MSEKSNETNTNYEADLLAEIYRGAKMGVEAIDTLMPKVNDKDMQTELMREQKEYRKFEQKAMDEMNKRGVSIKSSAKLQEMASWIGLQMNTAIDSTSSHIADILMQGNNMGIIGITKTMNRHNDADEKLLSLADDMVKTQEQNVQNLKGFLG